MRLLGLDCETTGFSTSDDRITELGVVLWDVEAKRSLVAYGVFFIDDALKEKFTPETVSMMERVCGITPAILEEFGQDPSVNLAWLDKFCLEHKVDYIVAHNGDLYDRPLLMAELTRLGVDGGTLRNLPWIDTRTDIPFASEPDSRKLIHLAVDHGFINPFAHRAMFDVLSMLRILSNYDINKVLEYQKIPFVTMRALVSYDQRQLAKDMRFSWEKLGERTYPKMWVRRIKETELDAEKSKAKAKGFEIARIE